MSTQPTSRAPYSLHNILEIIESSATLTPRQRQDQASAIRTVARLLGNTPAGIPANPQLLARRLDEIAPARHNLSPGRWANIRSLLRAALATVTSISPGRQQNPLTPDWAAAAAMLPPRLHHPLSKMMHYFAGQGVAPHQVDVVTLEGFAAFLDASLLAKPKAALNDSRAAWNRACRDIQNWPGTPLPVPPRQDHYSLAALFAQEFALEWNRLAAEADREKGRMRRELADVEKRLDHLVEAVASGLRSNSLQAKLAELEAEQTRLHHQLLAAPPSAVRLMPNLGRAYRDTLARLVETLAGPKGGEALHAARELIERVVIHPAPLRTPPGITVEGKFAAMLMMGQPGLSAAAADTIARAAKVADKETLGGQSPPKNSLKS